MFGEKQQVSSLGQHVAALQNEAPELLSRDQTNSEGLISNLFARKLKMNKVISEQPKDISMSLK